MNLTRQAVVFSFAATFIIAAEADEIYKNVDKKGAVEFSDRPAAGAKAVNVEPNVVDVTPVKPITPSPPAATRATGGSAGAEPPEAVSEDVSSGYYGDSGSRREKRREIKQRIEQGEKPARLPATGHPAAAPSRGGGHRR